MRGDLIRLYHSMSCLLIFAVSGCQSANVRGRPVAAGIGEVDASRDSVQRVNDRFVASVLSGIAGRETAPAGSVFRNVRLPHLAATPASQFVSIMNGGYARALGVTCTHCHVSDDFASDEKRPKRAAREMALMHFAINRELAEMKNLGTPAVEDRFINCATCHRGMVNPRGTVVR